MRSSFFARSHSCVWLLVSLLALLAGCESNEPTAGRIEGATIRVEDGEPFGNVVISLFDAETLRIEGVTQSDDEGLYEFGRLAPGEYIPVAYANGRVLFHHDQFAYEVKPGVTRRVTLRMALDSGLQDFGLRLSGRVIDATSGEPIEGAIVESTHFDEGNTSLFSELWGRSDTITSPTNAAGEFLLTPLFKFLVGEQEWVPHVRVKAPGYRSHFAGGWRINQIPQFLEFELDPGQDTGIVTGTLRDLAGSTFANLRVAVEWRRATFPKTETPAGKVLMPDLIGVSDEKGEFRIEGLPLGGFVLDPSFDRDDGFVGEQARAFEIEFEGQEIDVGPLVVWPAIVPVQPEAFAEVDVPFFVWEPVEDTLFYRVELRRALDNGTLTVSTETHSFNPDPDLFSEPGMYTWKVVAFLQEFPPIELGAMERPSPFFVKEGNEGKGGPDPWRPGPE